MAYAFKTDTAQVAKGQEDRGPWFGYAPKLVPFSEVAKAGDAAKEKAAKVHLTKAVNRLRDAVRLAPDNMAARLGYAWTLDQIGQKKEAITQYRSLIEDARKHEERENPSPLSGETVVTEAAGYLIPLLDNEKDKQEIATLRKRVAHLRDEPPASYSDRGAAARRPGGARHRGQECQRHIRLRRFRAETEMDVGDQGRRMAGVRPEGQRRHYLQPSTLRQRHLLAILGERLSRAGVAG